MRLLFILSLSIVAVYCYPYPDRWEFSDDFPIGEWGPNEGPRQRRPSPRFFDDDDNSGSEERQMNPMNELLQQLFEKYLKDMLNGTKYNTLPRSFHNETSVQEVVNGTIITVNETIDKETDADNNTFILDTKFIDVMPQNETSDEPKETASTELPTVAASKKPEEMTTEAAPEATSSVSKQELPSPTPTVDDLLNELSRSTNH